MRDTRILLNKAKEGIGQIDIGNGYKNSALKLLEVWLTNKSFKDYAPQIKYLIDTQKWDLILDSFYQIIPFGTGGRRGLVGIGPNRINVWTIQASAQGHSQYLLKQYGEKAKRRGIVLAYDVRKYTQKGIFNDLLHNPVMNLGCKQLAMAAAEVYAANEIKVIINASLKNKDIICLLFEPITFLKPISRARFNDLAIERLT